MIFTRESIMPVIGHWGAVLYRECFGLGIVLLTWLIFFSRILSGRFVYFLDDLKIFFFPLETIYAQAQANWHLPVWSNLFGFGHPIMGWGQLGFFTPIHVALRLFLEPLNVLQTSIVVYFLLGAVGMYVFLRRQPLSQPAAALGAIGYVFSGFNIGHLNHVNFYTATMVLPWLLIAVHYFLRKPTRYTALLMSTIIAIILLSAQPQIAAYSVVMAAIYGTIQLFFSVKIRSLGNSWFWRVIAFSGLSAFFCFGLASFALLPLLEFLPLTERAAGLPQAELFEFSYPPSHAITLIAPYFFGDHDTYWGAKGFQELAGFTGIIPLLLAGYSLTYWRRHNAMRVTAIVFIVLGVLIALGQYSPLYTYLVLNNIITSLATPGRFVFFFVTGIMLLAALALDELNDHQITRMKLWRLVPVLALPALIFYPFISTYTAVPQWTEQVLYYTSNITSEIVLLVLGAIATIIAMYTAGKGRSTSWVVSLTAATLLVFAWDYTPTTSRSAVMTISPLADTLYSPAENVPPRLYARPQLLSSRSNTELIATEEIGPMLTIFQPVAVTTSNPCFTIPITTSRRDGNIQVGLHKSLTEAPLMFQIFSAADASSRHQQICFPGTPINLDEYYLSLSSATPSGMKLAVQKTPGERSVYLIRKSQPTDAELLASQKEMRLALTTTESTSVDREVLLMERHLNVTAGASSARWIGALSIRPYREFIEFFFANDGEPIDGDGHHVITNNRRLLDFSGVTNLAQEVPQDASDSMAQDGFLLTQQTELQNTTFRLYTNPAAYPKAFIVPQAIFEPATDETRAQLLNPSFDVRHTIFVTGPVPPDPTELANPLGESTVTIVRYEDTRVDIKVESTEDSWLVITDTTTPQWQAYIDHEPQPYFVANTLFKTVFVPSGKHEVIFRYESPAIVRARSLTVIAIITAFLLLLPYERVYHSFFKKG